MASSAILLREKWYKQTYAKFICVKLQARRQTKFCLLTTGLFTGRIHYKELHEYVKHVPF